VARICFGHHTSCLITSVTDEISPWVAGYLDLPPKSIKDPESVGIVSQVFFVGDCQEKAGMRIHCDNMHLLWVSLITHAGRRS
jgi:hypothetical protein